MPRILLFSFLTLLISGTLPEDAGAVRSQRLHLTKKVDLERGKTEDISIDFPATLRLASQIRPFGLQTEEGNPQPFVWCQVADSRGRVFVGTGNEGKVFRVSSSGGVNLFFQTDEIEVTAMAIDQDDNLYIAASPPGRIYRVAPDGTSRVVFESEERYIWALVRTEGGDLYVATGEKGILFRIPRGGEPETILDSKDAHIVSLVLDGNGDLFAGTAGRGIVYRIRSRGSVELLYESGTDEVSALAIGPDGTLFASLLEARPPESAPEEKESKDGQPRTEEMNTTLLPPGFQENPLAWVTQMDRLGHPEKLLKHRVVGSRLIALSPEGWARTLWEADNEILYSLVRSARSIFAGTGRARMDPNHFGGTIMRFNSSGETSRIARVPESQVTSLLARPGGGLFAATSNLGNLYWIDSEAATSGTFTSVPVDAGLPAMWGRFSWKGETPAGSRLAFSTRTGNSSRPDTTWSSWKTNSGESGGSRIDSPPGRFLQWRVEMHGQAGGPSPVLREIWASYRQTNVPPRVQLLAISDSGQQADQDEKSSKEGEENKKARSSRPGIRVVTWKSTDPNGDTPTFLLQVREEGGDAWRDVADGILEDRYEWDTRKTGEGWYQMRIQANDDRDNPEGTGLTAEEISKTFIIDHTPPQTTLTAILRPKDDIRIEIEVTDNLSGIASIRYSLDQGPPLSIFPQDGIADSLRETVSLLLRGLAPGDHIVRFQTRDTGGNIGTEEYSFSVTP